MRIPCQINYRFWLKLSAIYFFIQTIVRSILIFERPPGLIDALDTFLDGALWDLGAWVIISFPLMLFSLLLPMAFHKKFLNSVFEKFLTFLFSFNLLFIGFCELVFWNEFHSRFNFIAVDYLVYTNEVLTNIRESYPIVLILSGVFFSALIISYASRFITFNDGANTLFLRKRTTLTIFGFVFPSIFLLGVGPWLENHDSNFHEDQLARNGMVEFIRAFRSNRIDYQDFYATLPAEKAKAIYEQGRGQMSPPIINLKGKRPNVVMIVVESLGAKFIAPLGGQKNTTPFLNDLSTKSVFFKNFYATGTRTVRGLEALTLSVPPTPGYAVVKRPDHKNLYSMGYAFNNNHYESLFLYGGNSFFDNMGSFFSGNGFQVIDESNFDKSEISFSNAWGVCDEDLFNKARTVINQRTKSDKPFLMFMLTTSNHRPFTYPNGKIDIPSGSSRAGAVKYTDFAIGKFLTDVQNEKWAQNTLFVIVADHSTEGRGQFDLGMTDFHIPLWIYAPGLLKPLVITQLGSQIDLLPSLIHLLNFKDDSPFFGQSLFNPSWTEQRAFVGNYQFVGHYKNQVLTTLGPNQVIRNYSYNPETKKQSEIGPSEYAEETISYYQYASHLLDSGQYIHPVK